MNISIDPKVIYTQHLLNGLTIAAVLIGMLALVVVSYLIIEKISGLGSDLTDEELNKHKKYKKIGFMIMLISILICVLIPSGNDYITMKVIDMIKDENTIDEILYLIKSIKGM